MDIDDFLDKELKGPNQKQEQQPAQNIEPSIPAPSSMPDISNDLWQQLLDRQTQWDGPLEQHLFSTIAQLQQTYSSKMAQSQQNILRTREAFSQLRSFIKIGQFENALKVRSSAYEIIDLIDDSFEQKYNLLKELASLHQDLEFAIQNRRKEVSRQAAQRMQQYISAAVANMRHRAYDAAKQQYLAALQIFITSNLDGPTRLAMGSKILALYKQISISFQIAQLQRELGILEQKEPISEQVHRERLVSNLLQQKINRAQENIKKGYSVEARRELEDILRLDPNNMKAKDLMETLQK